MDTFWGEYNKLPIVNPTKWKFEVALENWSS
jgi:hypothetical protein